MHPANLAEKDALVVANGVSGLWQVSAVFLADLGHRLVLPDDALPVNDVFQQVHVPHACCRTSAGFSVCKRNRQTVWFQAISFPPMC